VATVLKELNAYAKQGRRKRPLTVIKSTVPPGSTDGFKKQFPQLRLACNPEFLREWNAVQDFMEPDRVVAGTYENGDYELFREVYAKWKCPLYRLHPYEAELAKYLSNAYLVLKVAFSQEFKDVAGREVWETVGADKRIGFSHLDPTRGRIPKDTPCLSKDTFGFQRWLREKKLETPILDAAVRGGIEQ
jgi:UDPglucose 6-dehydrogenase